MIAAGLALLVAALGEAVARLPADACRAVTRGSAPRAPVAQLVFAWWRCTAVLGTGVATAATVLVLADPELGWAPAAGAVAVGLLPLVAAPLTAAPLLGAPLRIGLLAWCAVRVLDRLPATPATFTGVLAGVLAGAVAATVVGGTPAHRGLGGALRRTARDTVSVLVASPLMLAVGVVPVLVGLPLGPWELWRYCRRRRGAPSPEPPAPGGTGELFVVYLDGVGKTWRAPTRVARDLVAALGDALPGARVVTTVLPYSPLQLPLTERPGSGWAWRWLRRRAFPMLVGHNILQTLVAADARYQQAYGRAVAGAMAEGLRRAGYRAGDRVAVLGYSGGALIGIAAAAPLTALIGRSPVVVSLGGYLDGHGMPERVTVHHLVSSSDRLERLGRAMFPARWALVRHSAWNRARSRGAIVYHRVTGPRHVGPRGYLASEKDTPETSNLARTVSVMAGLLQSGLRY